MPQLPQPVTPSRPIPVPTTLVTEDSYIFAEASLGRLEPGATYASSDLYTYYTELCQEQGVAPLTANRYGRVLTRIGCIGGRDTTGSRRVWTMPVAS